MAKFLVVHPNLDIYGGGERVCHHVLKALVTHDQQVELLAFDFDEAQYQKIIGESLPQGISVHTLGRRDIVEAKPPLSMYKRRQKIVKLLKSYKANANYDYTFSTQTLSAFETELFKKEKKNIAYIHFPEIPDYYAHYKTIKKMYWWLYKTQLERHINQLGLVFCNSNYTKGAIEKYWGKLGIAKPVVAYPPVEKLFWSEKSLSQRVNRVVYTARFVPLKRHEILKQLATELPQLQFVSIGLLRDTEQAWFEAFSKDLPANYTLKPNLPEKEVIATLQNSTIYCHLMEGEHFGIAPMEALASGCITLVHDSGGSGEFIPSKYHWSTIEDLREKIGRLSGLQDNFGFFDKQIEALQKNIEGLKPQRFEEQIWFNIAELMKLDSKTKLPG
ncbi:glycosyltransferase [Candidatus Bathycorpusculum sp.]|uniref:glycosyltransferase n=1 Tax=Candidatus Bathycorpusculum sp. TaxID=2994959 RepID=UPI00282B81C6|nr:glycosyltransferase [Candidatus Termitimicrobium sp.]MCL2431739.1 glycosyltransferase [Candidatus Termitimicrobium sp.]